MKKIKEKLNEGYMELKKRILSEGCYGIEISSGVSANEFSLEDDNGKVIEIGHLDDLKNFVKELQEYIEFIELKIK